MLAQREAKRRADTSTAGSAFERIRVAPGGTRRDRVATAVRLGPCWLSERPDDLAPGLSPLAYGLLRKALEQGIS